MQPLVPMESTEPDASAPMGLWEFARHIRTITVMGTTVRLVAPTGPTEQDASDPMGLRSSAGHISGNNPGAAASREPKLEGFAHRTQEAPNTSQSIFVR
jgi:hypothetical protein